MTPAFFLILPRSKYSKENCFFRYLDTKYFGKDSSINLKRMLKLFTLLMAVCLLVPSQVDGFWWWFSSSEEEGVENEASQRSKSTEVTHVFAPFEISSGEEKFLKDAKNYLQNLPMLDQCNMLVWVNFKSTLFLVL